MNFNAEDQAVKQERKKELQNLVDTLNEEWTKDIDDITIVVDVSNDGLDARLFVIKHEEGKPFRTGRRLKARYVDGVYKFYRWESNEEVSLDKQIQLGIDILER